MVVCDDGLLEAKTADALAMPVFIYNKIFYFEVGDRPAFSIGGNNVNQDQVGCRLEREWGLPAIFPRLRGSRSRSLGVQAAAKDAQSGNYEQLNRS